MNHHGAAARGGRRELGKKMEFDEDDDEEYEIPWVLIPITGVSVCSVRHLYSKTDRVHFTII